MELGPWLRHRNLADQRGVAPLRPTSARREEQRHSMRPALNASGLAYATEGSGPPFSHEQPQHRAIQGAIA